ncbi:hypothetical protein ACWEFL_35655, partial [Streptomyces sp. NPDC004838]
MDASIPTTHRIDRFPDAGAAGADGAGRVRWFTGSGWDPVTRTWQDEAYDMPELPHGEPVQWLWL